jgi:DNA-binding transcriptional regulator of glucitol operon
MLGVGVALGIVLIVIDWLLARRGGWRACRYWQWASASTCRRWSAAPVPGAVLGWLDRTRLRRRALAAGADWKPMPTSRASAASWWPPA